MRPLCDYGNMGPVSDCGTMAHCWTMGLLDLCGALGLVGTARYYGVIGTIVILCDHCATVGHGTMGPLWGLKAIVAVVRL